MFEWHGVLPKDVLEMTVPQLNGLFEYLEDAERERRRRALAERLMPKLRGGIRRI